VNGVLRSEGSGRDGGDFKGIFARWATEFTRDNHIVAYDEWFQRNASAAWSHRNAAQEMDEDRTAQAGTGRLYTFDCSSAVVMLPGLPARTTRDAG
jgi:predicted alpha-1,6-mannanase (GH76 family)